ncbi:MAG: peptidase M48 [Chitinophaga sp.]|jgi:predicted Zn-dependent protease|nr:peptidase M48 [Chitinophaga sp.]
MRTKPVIAAFIVLLVSCTTNKITGRKQLTLVPESEMQSLALTQYKSFLDANKVVPVNNVNSEMVKRVGNRIAKAIQQYYASQNIANNLKDYQWEFNLVENNDINAWCMPGGKVVVYTGLLKVTQNETALAIVLGHEITHAVAGHGAERMSRQMAAQGIQIAGNVAFSNNPETVNIFNQVYPIGSQTVGILPNSRTQEYEADKFGLIFAAMAGYNPQEAIPFWQRMAALSASSQRPPEFLSDHPTDENRIKKLQELMPNAINYYNNSNSH